MIPLAETPIYAAMLFEQAVRDLWDRALAGVRQAWNAMREFMRPIAKAISDLAARFSTPPPIKRKQLIHKGGKP